MAKKNDPKQKLNLKKLQAEQNELTSDYEEALATLQDVTAIYKRKKEILIKFNDKYGRILQMIKEDKEHGDST